MSCDPHRQRDPSSAGLCVCRFGDKKRKLDPESRKMRADSGLEECPGTLWKCRLRAAKSSPRERLPSCQALVEASGAGGGPQADVTRRARQPCPPCSVSPCPVFRSLGLERLCQGPRFTAGPAPRPCPPSARAGLGSLPEPGLTSLSVSPCPGNGGGAVQ